MDIIEQAVARGQRALTEYESKRLLRSYGIPVTREELAVSADAAAAAAERIGFPVALKGSGPELMHKTEAGAVVLNLRDAEAVTAAFEKMKAALGDRFEGALVSEMVSGRRELVAGLHREPNFGPCVMLGAGGVLTEILNDTAFRVAPFDAAEAAEMAGELRSAKMLAPFRGEAAADMDSLCRCLVGLGEIGRNHAAVAEIDINPLTIQADGRLTAVDALVVLKGGAA